MSITRDEVLKMDLKSILAAVKDPKTSADMQTLMGTRGSGVATYIAGLMQEAQQREEEVDAQLTRTVPPSTEELAAQAQAMVAEQPAVAVAEPVVEAPAPERKKIVREYQVRDEDGTPIGRPTHLEAWSPEEMLDKMQTAHENATRAFHRLKKQKLTFKNNEPQPLLTPEEIASAAEQALQEKDPKKAQDTMREIIKKEFSAAEQKLQEQRLYLQGQAIGNTFKSNHLYDFNSCEANFKAIVDYLSSQSMDFTLDNVEAAFAILNEQGKFVPVEKHWSERKAVEVVNPTPVAAVAAPVAQAIPAAEPAAAVTASVVPQTTAPSQPVAETTVTTPVAPNQQPATRRLGVNGSIAPGTLSAQRPGTPEPALARKEFLKTVRDMKPEVMKAKLKNDPQFVKQLESYGIKVR
jgi:hypothetical protein